MDKKNYFWICGRHAVFEVINNRKKDVLEIIVNSEQKKKEIYQKLKAENIKILDNKKISQKISAHDINHQGYIAKIVPLRINKKIDVSKNLNKDFLILDGVTDPRNIGSIIRTAVAFNISQLIVKEREFNNKSIAMYKAASGAMEKIKIFQYSNIKYAIQELKKEGYNAISFDSKTDNILSEKTFKEKNLFIFGSENEGVGKKILGYSDQIVKIHIENIESLNVSNSVSAALSLYSYLKSAEK